MRKIFPLLLFTLICFNLTGQSLNNEYRSHHVFKKKYPLFTKNQLIYYELVKSKRIKEIKTETLYTTTDTNGDSSISFKTDTIWQQDTIFFELEENIVGKVIKQKGNQLNLKFIGPKYYNSSGIRGIKEDQSELEIDTSKIYYAKHKLSKSQETKSNVRLRIPIRSFRISTLAIPIKYRGSQDSIPETISTNIFNGAISFSFSYGKESYFINNDRERSRQHFFDTGLFFGFTQITLNKSNTDNSNADIRFGNQGAFSLGVSHHISLNNVNFTFAAGIDHGITYESQFWVYQNRPWIGIGLGVDITRLFSN